MRSLFHLFLFFLSASFPIVLHALDEEEKTPEFLYKVVSVKDWNESQGKQWLMLPAEDQLFIHLAKKDQLDSITAKYFGNAPSYVILQLDPTQLTGQLVLEQNPGGVNKYYHLYNGGIPLSAVVDSTVVKRPEE